MKIFYMNQGGGGQWGSIKYSKFDLILLAESDVIKTKFSLIWKSKTKPVMSIQGTTGKRLICTPIDLDKTCKEVRPMVIFQTTDGVQIVFVHLKSGNKKFATAALETAISSLENSPGCHLDKPTLWIGDFNRANGNVMTEMKAKTIFADGGQSKWILDRAYISGNWKGYKIKVTPESKAGADHGHVGFSVEYTRGKLS